MIDLAGLDTLPRAFPQRNARCFEKVIVNCAASMMQRSNVGNLDCKGPLWVDAVEKVFFCIVDDKFSEP